MPHLVFSFLEPLVLIILGGVFILAEVSLGVRKGDFEKIFSLRPPRPAFRLVAVFFFTLATLLAGEKIMDLLLFFGGLEHALLLIVLAILLTLSILFFGLILPRALGESHSLAGFIYPLSLFAQGCIFWIRPVASVLHFLVLKILKLLGLSLHDTKAPSDEELIHMMDEGLHTGAFNVSEREMMEGILELDEQSAASLMTPRSHVVSLNLDDTEEKNWRRIIASGHSEFPVFQGTQDNLIGIVSVKALWANLSLTGSVKLADVTAEPLYVPATMTASNIIEEFRSKKRHTALVVDEFGVIEGIITLKDVIESIVGVLPDREVRQHYPKIVKQSDGSWLVDAMLDYEEVRQTLGLPAQEEDAGNRYQTIGGFILHHLGRIPREGESVEVVNFHFQVLSMHQHRIDKLRVSLLEDASAVQ